MTDIEFEGRNVENAVQNACTQLNSSPDQLKYDILSRGSSGVFGLVGVKKARIRVTLKNEPVEPPPTETSVISVATNEDIHEGAKSLVDEAFIELEKKHTPPAKVNNNNIANQDLETDAIEILKTIVRYISDDFEITCESQEDRLQLNIKSAKSGVIIGKRGQTLEAIQYIIDKIINKKYDQRIRIQVDVEGYLKTRMGSLNKLALRMAEKAKKTGKPTTINQMNAHDRRIVHLALKDDREVKTQSMGEGYYRKLVIFPRRNNRRRGGRPS